MTLAPEIAGNEPDSDRDALREQLIKLRIVSNLVELSAQWRLPTDTFAADAVMAVVWPLIEAKVQASQILVV